jgi:tripartite-type tricarboxylate transporter receptor subunit TctC
VTWYGLFLPAKTPLAIVQKTTNEIQKLMNDLEVKKTLKDQGLQLVTINSEEFQSIVAKEYILNKKLSTQIEALP